MADSIKITGNLPNGDLVNFTLDGAATQRQMERLIAMISDLTDELTKGTSKAAREEKQHLENLKKLNTQEKKDIKQQKDAAKAADNLAEAQEDLEKDSRSLQTALDDLQQVSYTLKGGFRNLALSSNNFTTAVAGASGTLIGTVMGFADTVGQGLQRGVSGGVMDFAIAAKTGGITIDQFSKALAESGGAFASLGQGASIGAKNFGALIGEVRSATASVGNLGMTNEQLAMFTAQQTKAAVQQGFKGRQAQQVVINNSRALGVELESLASKTGKSVLEMAQAAMKLSTDPLVSSFIKAAGAMGPEISKAVQSLAVSLKGVFGTTGEKMAEDLAKSAMSGLPFAITQTGKNMAIASGVVYSELDALSKKVRGGGKVTEQDQERLRTLVLDEMRVRGDQIRMMAMLEGPTGDAARQMLQMAAEAENYNSEENVRARERDKIAQDFNASVRDMQANLQQLAIPFLNLINGVNWTFFIDILNGFVNVLQLVLTPLTLFGKILGDTGLGLVAGGLLAVVSVISIAKAGFTALAGVTGKLIAAMTAGTKALSADRLKQGLGIGQKPTLDPAKMEQIREMRKQGMSPLQIQGKINEAKVGPQLNTGYENVKKFSGAIAGATLALGGSALAIWGEARLREDANDTFGQLLVTVGTVSQYVGVFGGLILQFAPYIATAITSMKAYIVAKGGAIAAIKAFALTTKVAGAGFLKTLAVYGGALIAGLKASLAVLAPVLLPIALALTKFMLVVGAVVLVGAALYGAFKLLWEGVKLVGSGLMLVWEGIKTAAGWISSGISKLWDIITSPFTALWDWFKNSFIGKMLGLSDKAEDKKQSKSSAKTEVEKTPQEREREEAARSGRMGLKAQHEQFAKDAKSGTGYKEENGKQSRGNAGWNDTSKVNKNPDGSPMTVDQINTAKQNLREGNRTTQARAVSDATGMGDDREYKRVDTGSLRQGPQGIFARPADERVVGGGRDLVRTQAAAVDAQAAKDAEDKSTRAKQTQLLEELNSVNQAQLGVQSRSAGIQDNSNRYLRQQAQGLQ